MVGGQDDKLSRGHSILNQWDIFLHYFPASNHKTDWCPVLEKANNTNPSFTAYFLRQKTKCHETIKSEEENWHSFLIACLMNHLGPSSCKMRSITGNSWAGFEVLYFNRTNLTLKLNQLVTSLVTTPESAPYQRQGDRKQAPRPGGNTVAVTHRTLETCWGLN